MFKCYVIQFPTLRYGYVGRVPRNLGTEVNASVHDIMAGRTYQGKDGNPKITIFPTFTTMEEAIRFASEHGVETAS